MNFSAISWLRLGALFLVAACAGQQPAGSLIPQTARGDRAVARPANVSGLAEFPVNAIYAFQIASDLAGNEWVAAASPSSGLLLQVNEHTNAISTFALPASVGNPLAVALGVHRNSMWFTSLSKNVIGYFKFSNHAVKTFALPTAHADPSGIAAGPDNAMWFTENRSAASAGKIGRIDLTSFTISEYQLPNGVKPGRITLGTDGALWFTDSAGSIGRITTAGGISDYTIGANSPTAITTGPDGAIWFTGRSSASGPFVGRIDLTTHGRKLFKYSTGTGWNEGIATRDSELWMTAYDKGTIDRFDPATHTIHRRALPHGFSGPDGIVLGTDNQLWFTNEGPDGSAIGKLCPDLSSQECAQGGQ